MPFPIRHTPHSRNPAITIPHSAFRIPHFFSSFTCAAKPRSSAEAFAKEGRRRILHPSSFLLALLLLAAACQTAPRRFVPQPGADYSRGMAHRVAKGETLASLSAHYRRGPALLAKFNDLKKPYAIHPGKHLYIPPANNYGILRAHPGMMDHIRAFRLRLDRKAAGGDVPRIYAQTVKFQVKHPQGAKSKPDASPYLPKLPGKTKSSNSKILVTASAPKPSFKKTPRKKTPRKKTIRKKTLPVPMAPPRRTPIQFSHPLSDYTYMRGFRDSIWRNHDGVDFAAPAGTTIRAAAAGTVLITEKIGAYGNTVIIDHGEGFSTLYAHVSQYLVRKGDYVKKGRPIALVGDTGRSTGSHLHLEIRYNAIATDPEKYLPPIRKKGPLLADR